MSKRVVVTGLGILTSIGLNIQEFWQNALEGKCGISRIEGYDLNKIPFDNVNGGEIKNFNLDIFPENQRTEFKLRYGRSTLFALSTVAECLQGINLDKMNPFRIGVAIGTTMGESKEMEKLDDQWENGFSADFQTNDSNIHLYNSLSTVVARHFKLYGPNWVIPNACSAGNFAIISGYELIKDGIADVMVAGGSDSFSRYTQGGFIRVGILSPDVTQPFSKNRKGMIAAEGAGFLLLEEYEHALARNAHIHCELVGYGYSNDGSHITQANKDGFVQAFEHALKMSRINKDEVSYISAHGTGTEINDKTEAAALKEVFGDKIKTIPVNALKSMIGHTMGAASAIEAVAAVMSIKENIILPTINFTEIDPACEGLDIVSNFARKKDLDVVLNFAAGFGGNNSITIFKKMH